MRSIRHLSLLFALAPLAFAGCGGGGGGSSSGGSGTGRVGVFVTDGFREDYSHVWVTIYQVAIVNANNQSEVVFSDPAGRLIDLKTLRDASGERFSFLGDAVLSSGNHTKAQVTIDSTVGLVTAGSTSVNNVQVADSFPRDAQNHVVVTFNLANPRNLAAGNDDIVIDFDLSGFALVGGKLNLLVKEGGKSGLNNPARQERDHQTGTVSGLTSITGGFRFTLTRGNGQTFTVETNAGTAIYNANNTANPTLANGKLVKVEGAFNTATSVFQATSVRIEGNGQGQGQNEPEVKGPVSNINSVAGTFTVSAVRVRGFLPSQTTVNVVTNANTVFRSDNGFLMSSVDFFTQLAAGRVVEAEGAYNSGTNTLTATKVKLEEAENEVHRVEVRGGITSVNGTTGAFTVNPVVEFEGFILSGSTVDVTVSPSTQYRNITGQVISSTAFYASLLNTSGVKVEGTYSNGVIAATSVRLRQSSQL